MVLLQQPGKAVDGELCPLYPVFLRVNGKVERRSEVGLFQDGIVELGIGEVALVKNGLGEAGFPEIHLFQLAVFEMSALELELVKRRKVQEAAFKLKGQ